ncbi:hypothetical protein Pcinc_016734 [Petrolisthes cinctipes]|uniref:Uncharacterized protein n=1 Tax=Petrolisthes cinctipes TaxID=88211 RepID=A0AAE1FQR7_PETCI|nr:hypothetical protein Pcinc_016734 [Petrolisthes cinctipes]
MAGSAGNNTSPATTNNTTTTTITRTKAHSKSSEAEPSLPVKTTVRPGKRRHQSSTPPATARSESRSPRAKQRPVISRQSPPTISAAPVIAATSPAVAIPVTSGLQRSDSSGGSVSPSQLAVPRMSAEPPCPSKLPPPPVHWMAVELYGPAQRKHCRAVTESLLSHLTSSGILVKA